MTESEQAFKQLFSAEYSRLCRYALTYLQDAHQAEDVVQDTFIRIWETKRELIASPDIRFYLITAVRNNSISFLRKLKAQAVQFTEAMPEPDPEPFFTGRQLREEASDQERQVAEALNRLPPKCREVFLLVKMQGLSYRQAGEALDISVKTVENQMGKALKLLRENPVLLALLVLLFFTWHLPHIGVLLKKIVFL